MEGGSADTSSEDASSGVARNISGLHNSTTWHLCTNRRQAVIVSHTIGQQGLQLLLLCSEG